MSSLDGDGPCALCGTNDNIVWFTDNVLWNEVVGRPSILCVRCFVGATETAGFAPTGWRLLPEWRWTEAS